jgi:hypothetical protein
MTPSAAVSDFGGRRYQRFAAICIKTRPLSSIQFITGEKYISGVVDTGDSLLAVSLTPAITFFPGVVDTAQK